MRALQKSSGSNARDDYFGGAQTTNWQSGEHVMNLPPPPGGHPGGGGGGCGGGWHGQSSMMSAMSGEMATTHFSGSQNLSFVQSPGIAVGFNQSTFTYEDLANATNGFAQSNLLGQGGFGYVHKGVLPNGKEVAVKSLKTGSGQGEREFQAEVEIISRVHHRHLVSLVGYCIAGGQRMLVYEFVPNKTLEYHLHGADCPTMDFASRLQYASSGKLTEKSDVFSFGVMLLELITGRRPVDTTNRMMEDSLVDWARPLMKDDNVNYDELVDPRLGDDYNRQEMARMIACAAASIRHSARRRPKMSQKLAFESGTTSEYGLNPSSSSDDSQEMPSKGF
ncbi:Serine-threonine/tyrosine-protein kinase, catalytic domain [Dillenia turbinata]|uniref:non-specific serine/threonine protein kinase n=1 Tax=Dillenia turbinata TaxID=194707 RepID=A0AAN8V0N7_9MAGN